MVEHAEIDRFVGLPGWGGRKANSSVHSHAVLC